MQLIPALEQAIADSDKVGLLIEATDFHGWEWRAAFNDFKAGIKAPQRFLEGRSCR